MIDQQAEAERAQDTKINQKVNRAYREAFEAKFPDQCQHIMRLMAERLQQGLRKDAEGITNLEAAALAIGLAAIHSIHAQL
jgi:predicted DNA-binding WGR domain protein